MFERRPDRRLLLGGRGIGGRRRRTGAAGKHLARDFVHPGARGDGFGLGTTPDLGTIERRHQREAELLVVQFAADAKLALGLRHEGLLEPLLV